MRISTCTFIHFDDGGKIVLDQYISDVIYLLYRLNERIQAILLARAHYKLGLKDARDLCDHIGGSS